MPGFLIVDNFFWFAIWDRNYLPSLSVDNFLMEYWLDFLYEGNMGETINFAMWGVRGIFGFEAEGVGMKNWVSVGGD